MCDNVRYVAIDMLPLFIIEKDTLPFTSIFEKATLFESSLFAKDRLPIGNGQEQACTKITWLFVCLSSPCQKCHVSHHALYKNIDRRETVDCPLVSKQVSK